MSDPVTTQLSTQDYLRTVASALATCEHGRKAPIIAAAQSWLGLKSAQAVYSRLAEVGFDSGRKRRDDAGVITLPREEAEQIAAMIKATTRQTGKRLLSVADTVDVLRVNGKIAAQHVDRTSGEVRPLSTSAIINALRAYGLHYDQLAAPAPHVQLASLHPNHVWEMDFSVCVLFYLRGDTGLRVMKESVFNKNKPANVAKVEDARVQRIVVVDHTTHLLWLGYAHGAETAETAIDFLIQCMLQQDGLPYYGVPFVLYTDQGSAFKNATMENFCRRALIEHIKHESSSVKDDAARATGSVEVMNNIVERRFEGRLGIGYRVENIAELQHHARGFARWFNATQKHERYGLSRVDGWLKITEQQLRKPPAEDVLRTLAHTHPVTRTVSGRHLEISYAHKGVGSVRYSLEGIPGLDVRVGEKVDVVLNPFQADGIIIVRPTADGKGELHFPITGTTENEWGYAEGAPVIGESFAGIADTEAQTHNKRLTAIAMGTDTVDQAKDAKKAGRIPFAGIDPHKDHVAPDITYLPKRGTDLATSAPVFVAPVHILTVVDAARALRERIGPDAWTAEHYAALARFYPEGLAETDLDQAHDRLVGRSRLRIVGASD